MRRLLAAMILAGAAAFSGPALAGETWLLIRGGGAEFAIKPEDVARARIEEGVYGEPALWVDLRSMPGAALAAMTAGLVGREAEMLFRDETLVTVTLVEPLRGGVVVSGPPLETLKRVLAALHGDDRKSRMKLR